MARYGTAVIDEDGHAMIGKGCVIVAVPPQYMEMIPAVERFKKLRMFFEDDIMDGEGACDTAFAPAFCVLQHQEPDHVVVKIGMHAEMTAQFIISHMALVAAIA